VTVNGEEVYRKARNYGERNQGCTPYGWKQYVRTEQFPRGIDLYVTDHFWCTTRLLVQRAMPAFWFRMHHLLFGPTCMHRPHLASFRRVIGKSAPPFCVLC
jgi:hypothetical protein